MHAQPLLKLQPQQRRHFEQLGFLWAVRPEARNDTFINSCKGRTIFWYPMYFPFQIVLRSFSTVTFAACPPVLGESTVYRVSVWLLMWQVLTSACPVLQCGVLTGANSTEVAKKEIAFDLQLNGRSSCKSICLSSRILPLRAHLTFLTCSLLGGGCRAWSCLQKAEEKRGEGGKYVSRFWIFWEHKGVHNFLKWIYLKRKGRA